MQDAATLRQIKLRYRSLGPLMDERLRRQWAGTEAQAYWLGGLLVHTALQTDFLEYRR